MSNKNDWLVFPKRNVKAEYRLFCFPFAGGSPAVFRNWTQKLPINCELSIVQLAGRGSRIFEEPIQNIETLIEQLESALEPFTKIPFVFFGHSMGAILLFELVRSFRKKGKPMPKAMIVSGCVAPQSYRKERKLHELPHDELIAELKNLGGTPPELLENSELMEIILPIIRADFKLLYDYSYSAEEPFAVPIIAFGGDLDKDVPIDNLEEWKHQTTADFRCKIFSGDHFFLLGKEDDFVCEISRFISQLFSNKVAISTAKC